MSRHPRPSLNTVLGITKAEKPVKTEFGDHGGTELLGFWTNLRGRVGWKSEGGRLVGRRPSGDLTTNVFIVRLPWE
jgi:hypothetical protein